MANALPVPGWMKRYAPALASIADFAQASTVAAAASVTAAALTDNSGGSDTPDGTIGQIADIALSTSDTYSDSAVNTAVNAVVDDCANAIEECAAQINALVADVTELQTQLNALIAALKAANLVASS